MSKKRKHRKAGLPPGTLIYTGDAQTDNSNVVVIQYNESTISEHILRGADECPLGQEGKVTWYDVMGINNVKMIERIGHIFQIHPLALEDVLNTQQRPKWEDYQNGIFLIARSQRISSDKHEITTEQIAFFFSKNFIITFQEDEEDLFLPIRDRLHQGLGKLRQKGVDYLAYSLLDYIVDGYFIILDKTEEAIENLENKILNDFKTTTRNEIYNLKRQQSDIRRAVLPLREVIGRFSREDGNFVEPSNLVYIRDLHDHLTQLTELIENQRDMLQNLNDLFNAEQSNRANHVMKVLTIVSSIFIPLTFIVGVYGMNFDNLPELHFQNGYFAVWVLMIFIAILQLIYFKIKKWL